MKKYLVLVILFAVRLLPAQVVTAPTVSLSILNVIGAEGDGPGQFLYPNGLDVSPLGLLYVADTGNNRIQMFDANGTYRSHIGGFGWESEQFQQPMDVCCPNALDVYVADQQNSRIERYDKDLHWINSFYSDESGDESLQFSLPVSLGMNMHGELYLVDREYNRALKFNSGFEPVLRFADFDWGEGALKTPGHIHVGVNDLVYITDREKGCLNKYDVYGNYLGNVGSDTLGAPMGVCTGPQGLVLVTDEDLDQLLIFDANGRLLLAFGSRGDKFGAFNNPADVACYRNRVYVADSGNHRIQVFEIRVSK